MEMTVSDSCASLISILSGLSKLNWIQKLFLNQAISSKKQLTEEINQYLLNIILTLEDSRVKKLDDQSLIEILELKKSICNWRQSGQKNYANCQTCINKIEEAVNQHGKGILVKEEIVKTNFQDDRSAQDFIFILIGIFNQELGNENSIPLSVAYKVYDLNFDSFQCSFFVNMLQKSPQKIEHFDLFCKHFSKCSKDLIEIFNCREDGGFNLLKCASSIFAINTVIDKFFILKVISLFFDDTNEIEIEIFEKLFSNKNLDKSEDRIISTIEEIPKELRKNALIHAAEFFSPDLGLWEKMTFVLEVSRSGNEGNPFQIAILFKEQLFKELLGPLRYNHYQCAIQNIHLLKVDYNLCGKIISQLGKFYCKRLMDILKKSQKLCHPDGIKEHLCQKIHGWISSLSRINKKDELESILQYLPSFRQILSFHLLPDAIDLIAYIPKNERKGFIFSHVESVRRINKELKIKANRLVIFLGQLLLPIEKRNSLLVDNELYDMTDEIKNLYAKHFQNDNRFFFIFCLFYISECPSCLMKEVLLDYEKFKKYVKSGMQNKFKDFDDLPKSLQTYLREVETALFPKNSDK